MTKIVIGGDLCPVGRALPLFQQGDARGVFNDILPYFRDANLSVVNLECTLVESQAKPINKDGPTLGAPFDTINGIKNSHIHIANLANNHSFDFGIDGLRTTIEICEHAGIQHFGAGMNLREAQKVLVREVNGIRVGFLGMAEHEFSISINGGPGASPLDLIDFARLAHNTANDVDYLVVLLHAGKEHYSYPTPQLMKNCRFFVEQGANAVICQHSHCAGCYEMYQGAPIVYGQGNLVFDLPDRPDHWYEGFLVQIELGSDGKCAMNIVPYSQFENHIGVREMQGERRGNFLEALEIRSAQIKDVDFVHEAWTKYCARERYTYFSRLYGYSRLLRVLNRKIHFSDWLCSETKKLTVRNVVECETHREVLETLWREGESAR
jgi:poly-gamma-glutamate capsule biosynthesis protein CapA/YwtB (metallophosphatase superfamily)